MFSFGGFGLLVGQKMQFKDVTLTSDGFCSHLKKKEKKMK